MGKDNLPHLATKIKKIKDMEFKKKILSESLNLKTNKVKTFSEKPQNIVITEEQLERLIEKVNIKK
jgi:hypothetical protein